MTSLLEHVCSDDFIAGCIAGSIGIVLTQPMDTIRIRCQLDKSLGIRRHAVSIMKNEGMKGLFRGVASPTLTVGLMSACLFQSFETSKRMVASAKRRFYGLDHNPDASYADLAVAGSIAGAFSCLITSPTEMFKIKVQESTTAESATMRQEFREGFKLWKRDGFCRGVYRGLHVTVYRDAPAFAVYFPVYESFVDHFDPYRATQIVPFVGGGLAGMISWAAVYPMDHIKTLYQTKQYNYGTLPLRKAIVDHMAREGGARCIYKGLGATLLRCTPQHAVVFVCYEEAKKAMQRQRERVNDFEELIGSH